MRDLKQKKKINFSKIFVECWAFSVAKMETSLTTRDYGLKGERAAQISLVSVKLKGGENYEDLN